MKKQKRPSKIEANKFDKIFKENLDDLLPVILRRILGLKVDNLEYLPISKVQTTIEREPDFLCKVFNEKYRQGAVIHIEFESSWRSEIPYQMHEKHGIFYRKSGQTH